MPIARSTGMPRLDAQSDFARARRMGRLARVAGWLHIGPGDVRHSLPFEEVVKELGFVSEHRVGRQVVQLDQIVGSVDRSRDFDRRFRPTSPRTRGRWEEIATATRRGAAMPPVSLYRMGEIYFVRDGHHRISVARAMGWSDIDADVTEVQTRIGAERTITVTDLPLKGHERLFRERVPLAREARNEVRPSDPWDYGALAEGVEAWGFRAMQERGEFFDRGKIARMWLEEEYRPAVSLLRESGLIEDDGNPTDAYMKLSAERYRLLRTHHWDETALESVRGLRRR